MYQYYSTLTTNEKKKGFDAIINTQITHVDSTGSENTVMMRRDGPVSLLKPLSPPTGDINHCSLDLFK